MSTSMVIARSSIKEFKRVHNNYKAISIIASRFSPNGFIKTFKNGKTLVIIFISTSNKRNIWLRY